MEAARPLFPFLWLFVISTIWVFFSINDIINKEPRIMFILFGTLFSNIAVSIYNSFMFYKKNFENVHF